MATNELKTKKVRGTMEYLPEDKLVFTPHGTGQPQTLVQEQFTELRKNYYMVGVVNVAITRDSPAAERRWRKMSSAGGGCTPGDSPSSRFSARPRRRQV